MCRCKEVCSPAPACRFAAAAQLTLLRRLSDAAGCRLVLAWWWPANRYRAVSYGKQIPCCILCHLAVAFSAVLSHFLVRGNRRQYTGGAANAACAAPAMQAAAKLTNGVCTVRLT